MKKKSFRGTWIGAAVVLLLAGYTFWDSRSTRDRADLQDGERPAFTLKRDEITHVGFERGGEKIVLDRRDDEWRMSSPVEDFADDSTVDGFLFSIMGEKLRTFRDDSGEPDWAKYGLKPPGVTIELGTAKAREKIEVSTTNAFNGSFYVRQGDELLAGATSLAQSTDRRASSFRSRRIWRHADAKVSRVKADYGSSSFTLDRSSGTWVMTPAPKFALDPERVDKWVDAVEDLTAADFVREGTRDQLGEFGLDRPRLTVAIDYQAPNEKPGQWVLRLSPEKGGDVFFFTNDRDAVIKIAAPTVRRILATPEYFRDGHQPFKFDAEAAREVRVRSAKIAFTARKNGDGWALEGAKDGATLNEPEFREFVGALGALRAVDFPGATVKVKPAPTVEIRDGAGRPLLALSFGDEYKSKAVWNEGAALRAVSTGKETLGLPKAQIDNLIKASLIKDKAPAPAARPSEAKTPAQ